MGHGTRGAAGLNGTLILPEEPPSSLPLPLLLLLFPFSQHPPSPPLLPTRSLFLSPGEDTKAKLTV